MSYRRGLNNKMNRMHEIALTITYNDKSSSYRELLTKNSYVIIHHRNIRALAIEIYKFIQGISAPPMKCLCHVDVIMTFVETTFKREKLIWKILPNEINDSDTLQTFKSKIEKLVPVECPCRLCKIYLPPVGFI